MGEAADKIKAHFESLSTKVIEVPEWGLTIYSTPVTLPEKTRIYKGTTGDNDYGTIWKILLYKAKDESGKPLFTLEDRPTFEAKCEADVAIRVAAAIMGGASPPAEELKNS